MNFSIRQAPNGVWYGSFPEFDRMGIKHGFATRLGGLSEGPYKSLNLVFRARDKVENVIGNRQKFCEAIGVDFTKAVGGHQVHGDKVAVVTLDHAGKGARSSDGLEGTDALITNVPGIPLMIFFADCVPLLLVDPVRKVIGACHAGWRGTVAQIGAKTVQAMERHFGTNPKDCRIALGPSIGPCCYEVDYGVVSRFQEAFSWWEEAADKRGEKWLLNLWEANRRQLIDVGVPAGNIAMSEACTACNTQLFFSYRAENGDTGNLAAIISL